MSQSVNSSLPQGFSVFQPALGAQLQFFPAIGSLELDELLQAHLPGSASMQEKRAAIALDFLEHAQMTGQNFKFYPVYTIPSASTSPTTSVTSSFNVSPVSQSWNWSQTSRNGSVSSRSSTHRVSKPASSGRHRPTDFSHIPGMKIMTKDGLDVTNSASRGSKTKEQRDHAHLMRIIKACDACRKKKIRCDPSHKRRGTGAPTAQVPVAVTKAAAKPTTSPLHGPSSSQSVSPPHSITPQSISPAEPFMLDLEQFDFNSAPFFFDPTFAFEDIGSFEPVEATDSVDEWSTLVQYPATDTEDFDFFADSEGSFISQPSSASDSVGSSRSGTVDAQSAVSRIEVTVPQPPYLDEADAVGGPLNDYADFNLYSPGSTFSEDDRMLDISSSSSGLSSLSQTPSLEADASYSEDGLLADLADLADDADVEEYRRIMSLRQIDEDPGVTTTTTQNRVDRDDIQTAAIANMDNVAGRAVSADDVIVTTNSRGQLVICCPPGTVVITNRGGANASGNDSVNVPLNSDTTESLAANANMNTDSAIASVSADTTQLNSILAAPRPQQTNTDLAQATNDDYDHSLRPNDGSPGASQRLAGLSVSDLTDASLSVRSLNRFMQKLSQAVVDTDESPGASQASSPVESTNSSVSDLSSQGSPVAQQNAVRLDVTSASDGLGVPMHAQTTETELVDLSAPSSASSASSTSTAASHTGTASSSAINNSSVGSHETSSSVSPGETEYPVSPTTSDAATGDGQYLPGLGITTNDACPTAVSPQILAPYMSMIASCAIANFVEAAINSFARWHSDGVTCTASASRCRDVSAFVTTRGPAVAASSVVAAVC